MFCRYCKSVSIVMILETKIRAGGGGVGNAEGFIESIL